MYTHMLKENHRLQGFYLFFIKINFKNVHFLKKIDLKWTDFN